ncbi:penicillin-binding protein 1A [Salinispira pacifica]|uniref:peptidoglycan glycosyltransferase n=1 Tax=Salinispira pacifica TaxID=1307761 RepID=V5WG38_9SPIO|nr:PBP1A family penicillin-binding protein [Salinispira pacifica]AHC14807.1 Multimodular transpeptidase-transglycosylase [Salinispira pacifica]
MALSKKGKTTLRILAGVFAGFFILFSVVIGIALGATYNLEGLNDFNESEAALPTQIYDRNGRLITEFFSDEKRELISIEEMPRHLIYAVITREDQDFFQHKGVSITGTTRAAIGYLTNNFAGGGSTLTQQLATMLYLDKSDVSVSRKLQEIWIALQLERNWSKNEILEEYLNKSWFGHNTYGVEAASKFFFGHSAREVTIAESMMLALQLSSTNKYSPLKNPNLARERQKEMLDEMVVQGYATQEEVEASFDEFWRNYDYTRSGTTTAFFERQDKAPYFSEHVRYLLENEILLGSADIYRDGYKVYTTLDLDYQDAAREYLQVGIQSANETYDRNISSRARFATEVFVPAIDLLSLGFNVDQLRVAGEKQLQNAKTYFRDNITPMIDMLTLLSENSNDGGLRDITWTAYQQKENLEKQTTVQGALISLENETGHVLSMIGGNKFEQTNQLNRALQARVQPGSSFKPLYYSAAIEKEVITPATMIYDSPVVFWNDDGTPYTPTNYKGEWEGPVLARYALAKSMNVPSLRILNRLGFDDAISITSDLLGIPEREQVSRGLVRKYPIGLGVISVSPIMMAQAFATFPNEGREVTPVFIRYVEDRSGRIVAEPERNLREEQARQGRELQIISPQTAYIMTEMLQTTVQEGTLRYPRSLVGGFGDMPIAGKTGTTQNWSALWTVGFSPYYTTAVWIGFDEGNNSMGVNQTGAITAGPIWARYMKEVHRDLEPRTYNRPANGLIELEVTNRNGLLPPAGYNGATYTEIFREGTEPREFDTSEEFQRQVASEGRTKLDQSISQGGVELSTIGGSSLSDSGISLDLDLELSLDLDGTGDGQGGSNGEESGAGNDGDGDSLSNPFFDDSFSLEGPGGSSDVIPPEGGNSDEGGNPYLD